MKYKFFAFCFFIHFHFNVMNGQQLGLFGSINRAVYISDFKGISNYDTSVVSDITNYQDLIFDYNFGTYMSLNSNWGRTYFNFGYERNSIKTIASGFFTNGQLVSFHKLHYLKFEISAAKKIKIKNKNFLIGGGVNTMMNILKNRTIKKAKNVFLPSSTYGPSYSNNVHFEWKFGNTSPKQNLFNLGLQLIINMPIIENDKKRISFFGHTYLTLTPPASFQWYFNNESFAFNRLNRLLFTIGIQYDFLN